MLKRVSIWLFLLICTSYWSCQEPVLKVPDYAILPDHLQLFADSSAIDTSYTPPLRLPFQWLDHWSQDSLDLWLGNYADYTQSNLLPKEAFISLYADQQILGFPQKKNNKYYALADFAGKRGIYQGTDLSTLSTYEVFLLDEDLNLSDYQIYDFAFLGDSLQQLALLLYHNNDAKYTPASYNLREDSLTLWANLDIAPNWQIKGDKIWVHSLMDQRIFQIESSQSVLLTYDLSWVENTVPQFLAVLKNNQILIKVKEGLSDYSYYQLTADNLPQRIFTFKSGRNQWLGYHQGLHYFKADFKNGSPQIFSFQNTPQQDLLQTVTIPDDTLLLEMVLHDSLMVGLYGGPHYTILRKYSLKGKRLSSIQLREALITLDLQHYQDGDHTLIRQLSPEDGLRWLNVDTKLPEIVEPVYRSLLDQAQFSIQKEKRWIPSYDGALLPLTIYHKRADVPLKKRPSLIIPVSSNLELFRKNLIDLAVINRSLQANYIVVFVFPRGNQRKDLAGFIQGSGPYLQLAYDDLQASLSYLNEQQLGSKDQRIVWGIDEGALATAALYTQRPDLAHKVIIQDGIFDLRQSAIDSYRNAFQWVHPIDSLSDRLSIQYSPQFYPIRSVLYPNCLVQTSNQSIFADQLQSFKWIGKLQNLPDPPNTWLFPQVVSPVGEASGIQEWEQMVWNYIQKEYVSR